MNFGTNRGKLGSHVRAQPGQFVPNLIPEFLVGLIDEGDNRDSEDTNGRYDLRSKDPVFAGRYGHLPAPLPTGVIWYNVTVFRPYRNHIRHMADRSLSWQIVPCLGRWNVRRTRFHIVLATESFKTSSASQQLSIAAAQHRSSSAIEGRKPDRYIALVGNLLADLVVFLKKGSVERGIYRRNQSGLGPGGRLVRKAGGPAMTCADAIGRSTDAIINLAALAGRRLKCADAIGRSTGSTTNPDRERRR
ncbi:MAG: hypothetical protein OXD39_03945 [Gemmatimonadetes bacterium]|nr:hypothetical protein [Gemmatimonadota bacterium]